MNVQIEETLTLEPSMSDTAEAEHFDAEVEAAVASVEALLFVASEALSIKTIAKFAKTSEVVAAAALQRITDQYAERGIVVREIGGGYRFATSPKAREAVEAYLLP